VPVLFVIFFFLTDFYPFSSSSARFDRILCDVPCSGDGALRKSPMDLPLWQPQAGLGEHPRQLAILMRGLELLAPGGRITLLVRFFTFYLALSLHALC
jgi:16S rRNA C967 or C1407 C5-methylase (RsmB/RsmF family)